MNSNTDDKSENNNKSPLALVVEDDPAARQLLTFMLRTFNIDAIVAESGEQALEVIEGTCPHIMLLDISLGEGMTGLDLGARLKLRDAYRETPIIAVTAFSREHLDEFEKCGFSGYISKPYTRDDLQRILTEYLQYNT